MHTIFAWLLAAIFLSGCGHKPHRYTPEEMVKIMSRDPKAFRHADCSPFCDEAMGSMCAAWYEPSDGKCTCYDPDRRPSMIRFKLPYLETNNHKPLESI